MSRNLVIKDLKTDVLVTWSAVLNTYEDPRLYGLEEALASELVVRATHGDEAAATEVRKFVEAPILITHGIIQDLAA
jgi:hypothetical protein